MAHISQDSSSNDASTPASTSSRTHDEHKNRRKRKPKESGAESNNIRPPHKVFSSAIRAELYEYLDGYPLERLNDSNTTYLDNQMRQVNFLLDTSIEVPLKSVSKIIRSKPITNAQKAQANSSQS